MSLKLFRNVLVFQLTAELDIDTAELNEALATKPARMPGPTELSTFGFVEPAGEEDRFVEQLTGSLYLKSVTWKRDLPAAVVQRELATKIRKIEADQQRKVYGKERRDLKDEIIQTLLPRAFPKAKSVSALIIEDLIFLDTSSAKQAEDFLSQLRTVIGSLPVRPLTMQTRPSLYLTDFVRNNDTGNRNFALGDNFTAHDTNDESSTIAGGNTELDSDDIRNLMFGRQVTSLGLHWLGATPVSFTLTEDMLFKGIRWPDAIEDQAADDAGEEAHAINVLRATVLLLADALWNLVEDTIELMGGREHAVSPLTATVVRPASADDEDLI